MTQYFTLEDLENAPDGWFFDPDDRNGIVHVKTQSLPVNTGFTVKIDHPIQVSEKFLPEMVKILPNPTNGEVTVVIPDGLTAEIQVFDSSGKLVVLYKKSNSTSGNFKIDLSDRPTGLYTFYLNVNSQVFSRKVSLVK